jgi:hypothetical protein
MISTGDHSMFTGLLKLKLLSTVESHLKTEMLYVTFVCYLIYQLSTTEFCSKYLYQLKDYFWKSEKSFSYELDLFYILPGTYVSGKIETTNIAEAIMFDVYHNRTKYHIPEFRVLPCNSQENTYFYIPDHKGLPKIKIMFNKHPIYLVNTTQDSDEPAGEKNKPSKTRFKFELYCYNNRAYVDDYIDQCVKNLEEYNDKQDNKYTMIHRPITAGGEGIFEYKKTKFSTNKNFKNLIIDHDIKDKIKKAIDDFYNNLAMYKKLGTPHKLGIILFGPPGTGKSSVIKAVISYCQTYNELCHIYDINLSNLTSEEEAYDIFLGSKLDNNIAVLEEIDQADCVKPRKAKQDKDDKTSEFDMEALTKLNNEDLIKKINMYKNNMIQGPKNKIDNTLAVEDFLKIFDGIHEMTDRIFIATTNHIEDIDPAVLRRFDLQIELGYQSSILVKEHIELFFDETVSDDTVLPHMKMTGCQVEQICKQYNDLEGAIKKIQSKYLID